VTSAKVFASVPLVLFAFAESLGMGREQILAIAELRAEDLAEPDELVDYEALVRLWAALLAHFPGAPLGARFSALVGVEALGVVGYAMRHARDGRHALALLTRYSRLADPFLRVTVDEKDGQHRLIFDHEPRVTAMIEPLEMMVLGTVRLASALLGRGVLPSAVCFRHERRHPRQHYGEVLGPTPVHFGAAFDGIDFPSNLLDLPLCEADPRIAGYLGRHAEALLETVDDASFRLDSRVRQAIAERLLSDGATPEAVARALGTSRRSLQRGLKALGTSFSGELDRVRREQAMVLLRRPELTVAEIAFMLGYSEPRVFHRCFRRWTGRTPSEYRRLG
jgi:AraC-like DNA-binding protein